jgi:hypothetical protein
MGPEIIYEHEISPVVDLNIKDTLVVALKDADSWIKVEQNGNFVKLVFEIEKMLPGDFSLTIVVSDQTGL